MRTWDEPKKRKAHIELIPMIDVMMFLLVFSYGQPECDSGAGHEDSIA